MKKLGMTSVELLAALLLAALLALVFLPGCLHLGEARQRMSCQDNLKELGVAFRMYAGESKADKWPPMHGDEIYGEDDNCPSCLNGVDDADYFADMSAIFPEYVRDPRVLICPADGSAALPLDEAIGRVADDGSGMCPSTCLGQITQGDQSYVYLGWVLDKVQDTDPGVESSLLGLSPSVAINAQQAGVLAYVLIGTGAMPIVGESPRTTDNPATPDNEDNDLLLERDINLARIPGVGGALDPLDAGSGAGDMVLRLRDRVERFLITDINNPAASEQMQARLPVAWDHIVSRDVESRQLDLYNHRREGGANVLFKDGHVEFTKYPGKFPASRANASLSNFFL